MKTLKTLQKTYHKYGIQYAMPGHAGAHVISKLVRLSRRPPEETL